MGHKAFAKVLFDDDSIRVYDQSSYRQGASESAITRLIARFLIFGRDNHFDTPLTEHDIQVVGPKPVAYCFWTGYDQKPTKDAKWENIDPVDYRALIDQFKTGMFGK